MNNGNKIDPNVRIETDYSGRKKAYVYMKKHENWPNWDFYFKKTVHEPRNFLSSLLFGTFGNRLDQAVKECQSAWAYYRRYNDVDVKDD